VRCAGGKTDRDGQPIGGAGLFFQGSSFSVHVAAAQPLVAISLLVFGSHFFQEIVDFSRQIFEKSFHVLSSMYV
jgi:hypothetical protein